MQRRLQDWLDLSLHSGLPSSLLLLSRAFTITADVTDTEQKKDIAYEKVKETLSSMPSVMVDKVGLEELGGQPTGVEVLQRKLDLLKREELLIKEELKRAAAASAVPSVAQAAPVAAADRQPVKAQGSETVSEVSEEEAVEGAVADQQRRLRQTVQALIDLATGSGVAKERVAFMELLKTETARVNKVLFDKPTSALEFSNRGMEVTMGATSSSAQEATTASSASAPPESVSDEVSVVPKRLSDRVSKMLMDIEKELDKAEQSIGSRMHVLDTDKDGVIDRHELQAAFNLIKAQLSEFSVFGVLAFFPMLLHHS